MAQWHGYIGVENLNLNTSQRQILIDEIKALGPTSDPQPARLNHWRTRLDNQAAIFEANFNENNLTINKFKQRLGTIFGVDPATINHSTVQPTYATRKTPVVTFARSGTDYVRFAAFGGTAATWPQSRVETVAFLIANSDDWEPAE